MLSLFAAVVSWGAAGTASAVTIDVKGVAPVICRSQPNRPECTMAPLTGFRYTIEEDRTFEVVPGVTGLQNNIANDPTLALGFHKSYMPVVQTGHVNGASLSWTPPATSPANTRYYISVMPDNLSFGSEQKGYTIGGAPFKGTDGNATVLVNALPFQTAQISVLVFEDSNPINNQPDAVPDQERGLCGFEVLLFEAGGAYGASGGRVATDTFGNWLGTEYNADGSVKKEGSNQLFTDANGVLRVKNLSPAKYTIFVVPPAQMPSADQCRLPDGRPAWIASGNPGPGQSVWNNGWEFSGATADGDQTKWHQTTTIEGTWGNDAWVKSGEPAFFKEFGPPGHHVFMGFTRRFHDRSATGLPATNDANKVVGQVRSVHLSRPPFVNFHEGPPQSACWIGLNEVTTGVGLGRGLYSGPCETINGKPGSFEITGLEVGKRYRLAVWDEPLDNIFASYEFLYAAPGTLDLKSVPSFHWFANVQGRVFYDQVADGKAFDAAGMKPGIPNSVVNLRFRDGSIYQSTVTDEEGNYEFPEVFPFFNWQVAETDFTRFKATGATIITDNGGNVSAGQNPSDFGLPAGLWPDNAVRPQLIVGNGGKPYRIFGFETSAGPTEDGSGTPMFSSANLLQGFQGFIGLKNVIHWGKKDYSVGNPTDHGGITGVVHYASTRAEFDPKFATAENNEPGVPGVEIRLYRLNNQNKVIDPRDPTGNTLVEPKDANAAHAVQIVTSDSWDDNLPSGCVDPPTADNLGTVPYQYYKNGPTLPNHCHDGLRNHNQVRDAVFDGGFGFSDYCPRGVTTNTAGEQVCVVDAKLGDTPQPLPPGRYMLEGVAPRGYEHQKEEDKNVDFGDLLVPGTLANPAECLGSRSEALDDQGNPLNYGAGIGSGVPTELTLFAGVEIPEQYRGNRPYCNKKLVVLSPGMNPFADFHLFTKTPVAAHIVGVAIDDLANWNDPFSPTFGEKYTPPFIPVSVRDFAGNEINRVYTDRYGTYNALIPSTFAYNVPMPSGVAPNMVTVCLNAPTMKNAAGETVKDPHHNPQYSQFCYTFQYLPGKTTYLDTPLIPIAAFAGPAQQTLDCEQPDLSPAIKKVSTFASATPAAADIGAGPVMTATTNRNLRIYAMGNTEVPNPLFNANDIGNNATTPKTISRNYGFGTAAGKVFIGGLEMPASAVTWGNDAIDVVVPASVTVGTSTVPVNGGTVEVQLPTGARTVRGVTLHTVAALTDVVRVGTGAGAHATIQAAIDAAPRGALVIVEPGLYEESPILWKRLRVQGYGAPVTLLNATMAADSVKQHAWREKVCDLVRARPAALGGPVTPGGSGTMANALLTGQILPNDYQACLDGNTADNAPLLFAEEEGAGFFILLKSNDVPAGAANLGYAAANVPRLQIDGFTITGADTGGGIVANGNAVQLQVSNNRISGNQGLYGGGVRIGHKRLLNGTAVVSANNPLVDIHHNEIVGNGNLAGNSFGGGGGISMYNGAHGYRVAQNYVCGNMSTGDGGGMDHYGLSTTLTVGNANNQIGDGNLGQFVDRDNRTRVAAPANGPLNRLAYAATVSDNQFRFNQSFNQGRSVQGGGLAVMGILDPAAPINTPALSLGTGNVTIVNNTFQGNLAGAGDGGGIALYGVNGAEIPNGGGSANPNAGGYWKNSWNRIDVLNNVIVNNGTGVAGGGIALQDAANVNIVNNTIAANDSYATAARAFGPNANTNAQGGQNSVDCLGNANPLPFVATSCPQLGAGIAAYGHTSALAARAGGTNGNNNNPIGFRTFSDATITNSVVMANRVFTWTSNYAADPAAPAQPCSIDASQPCYGLAEVTYSTPPSATDPGVRIDGADIAVLAAAKRFSPSYSVFTKLAAGDGTNLPTNRQGLIEGAGNTSDFASAYFNGRDGDLRQLLAVGELAYRNNQGIITQQFGGEGIEVAPAAGAAFDEGGNFIDVRFGPLTRGETITSATPPVWFEFGTYLPTAAAAGANAVCSLTDAVHFSCGNATVTQAWPRLGADRNGVPRWTSNWVRGALMPQAAPPAPAAAQVQAQAQ